MKPRFPGAVVGVVTALALGGVLLPLRSHLAIATAGMVLVVPVVAGVIAGGYPGGVASVVAGFAVYDVAFIPPYWTFNVGAGQNWVALGVYVIVMLLVAQVASHLDSARAEAQRRELEARRLSALSELLVEGGSVDAILRAIVQAIWTMFEVEAVALLLPGDNGLRPAAVAGCAITAAELTRLSTESGGPVPVGTFGEDLAGLRAVALSTGSGPVGMLALRGLSASAADGHLLRTFANHAALVLERAQLRTRAQRAELLEEVDRIRQDLLGAVSHDLRTPLATMKVATSTLSDQRELLSEADTDELYALLERETDHLSHLVTSLLDLGRFEAGVLKIEAVPGAVLDLVADALVSLRPSLGERTVDLEISTTLPDIDADPVLIGQVLVNLLENADRHAPPDTPITVSAALRDGRVEVAVTDHGPGLRPEELDSVFQTFVRFDTGGRAGLGLAIVKTFVEAHHQRVWAENLDDGAKFVFTLPVHPDGVRP